ncbi:hypothetical protein HD806DRAFT_526299 [Xylariaceae sp. AK1471]|nr:hypothetical protein HD806DRAFT_526299 [Xylariaceae sp. AK1471]
MAAPCVDAINGGLGRDMRITASEDSYSVVILFQAIFVAEIGYTYSSPLIKLSMLAFYWRIFPASTMKLGCKILASACWPELSRLVWFARYLQALSIRRASPTLRRFVTSGVATVIEIYASVVGACLPTLIPVYRQLRYGSPLAAKMSTASKAAIGASGATPAGKLSHRRQFNTRKGSFERLAENDDCFAPRAYHTNHHVNITSRREKDDFPDMDAEAYPLEGVVKRRDTVWTESRQNQSAV